MEKTTCLVLCITDLPVGILGLEHRRILVSYNTDLPVGIIEFDKYSRREPTGRSVLQNHFKTSDLKVRVT